MQNHRRLTKHLVTQLEVAPIQRIFARLRRLLTNDLAARDIQLTTNVTPETLEISADIELLDQALINLVRNAIEALRDTVEGRIVLSARRDPDGRVTLAVADNGPGIAPDQREKIFVPFLYDQTGGQRGGAYAGSPDRNRAWRDGRCLETSGGGATVSLRF